MPAPSDPSRPARARPDTVLVRAVDEARAAAVAEVGEGDVGEAVGTRSEGERVVSHLFACRRPGYRGWHWSVTLARAPRQRHVTVDEVVLLPGDDSVLAPAWVPWAQRLRPGDVGPGDLLPVEEDDPRLVPGWLTGDSAAGGWRELAAEIGLGRERVLSLEGRDIAAQRWYDGDNGPHTPLAQAAPGRCVSCGFLVRVAGPLGTVFGVCANGMVSDDGSIVSFDHGCGGHSDVTEPKAQPESKLPEPSFDTVGYAPLGRD